MSTVRTSRLLLILAGLLALVTLAFHATGPVAASPFEAGKPTVTATLSPNATPIAPASCVLNGSNQHDKTLAGCDFTGQDLAGFNFQSANLSGANLSNANLQGANLNGADLTGAALTSAI